MTISRVVVTALTTAAALSACDAPPVDVDDELASLREAAGAYHVAATAKDRAGVVALYEADAVMIPPNADLVEGLAGVEGYRFGFIETPGVALDFEIVRAEVSATGDMGWTLSIGQITIDRGNDPPGRDVVRDFHVWRKHADGTWKLVVDVWNSGLPAG